jgi:hypothetical protein
VISLAGWVPFVTPAPIWDWWSFLLLPVLLAVAVAYKATKVATRKRLAWETGKLFTYLLALMVFGHLALHFLVEVIIPAIT